MIHVNLFGSTVKIIDETRAKNWKITSRIKCGTLSLLKNSENYTRSNEHATTGGLNGVPFGVFLTNHHHIEMFP